MGRLWFMKETIALLEWFVTSVLAAGPGQLPAQTFEPANPAWATLTMP